MTAQNSKRVELFWTRLRQWYGNRIVEQYGEIAPPDWAKIIDLADNDQIKNALTKIRSTCAIHPPTFPQFEMAIKAAAIPIIQSKPDKRVELIEWIMKNKKLTKWQTLTPWIWIVKYLDAPDIEKKMREKHGAEISGVIIPDDDEEGAIGHRVMFDDMRFG